MADIIPSYSISEFRKLRVDQVRRLKSAEITSDGEYLFTFVNPTTDYIKLQAENLGQLSNSIGKEPLEQLWGVEGATV